MAYATRFSRDLNQDSEALLKNMRSGDYEHLLEVFDDAFGDFVILER
jgi:hypothetical protein